MSTFLDKKPEEVDAIIKTKVKQFLGAGGKGNVRTTKWSEDELQLRDAVIMAYITENGLSRERTAQQIASRWDIGMSTARKYVKEAVERFCQSFDNDFERLRKVFLERVENLYNAGLEDGQKDIAARALDMMGKSVGAYSEKRDVNVSGDININFDYE